MKLRFATQALAKTRADEIHAWLIQNDSKYAQSVDEGQTVRWGVPMPDSGEWVVMIKPRCLGALSAQEAASL